jgi:putative DNA primase/helicase
MSCIFTFRDVIQSVYGSIDWTPIPSGQIYRFTVPGDRPGSKNGWYVLHPDGITSSAFGKFGSWKIGDYYTWSSKTPTDRRETEHLRCLMERAQSQREVDLRQRQQSTAEYAGKLWCGAQGADPGHLYLTIKGVQPYALRQKDDALLVPLFHDGKLVNVQRIKSDGSKRFLSGGRVKGCYSLLGVVQSHRPLYLCEGWATGATVHAVTGHPVACAMNAGNLLPVGQYLRSAHPDAMLIVAGDDDRQTEGNPGKTAAIKAAETLCCGLILPPWRGDEPLHLSDFNDLHQWREAQR